jgi:uncharacterized iron-regulated protein
MENRSSWAVLLTALSLLTACHLVTNRGTLSTLGTTESERMAAQRDTSEEHPGSTAALDLRDLSDLNGIIPELSGKRVIFVGESHPSYSHHLTQLEIIRRLHAIDPRLAIGMEYFQQPFQSYLDEYVAGRLDEKELLRKTEYYERWRFDFRLYEPILRFARGNGISLVALNLPREITKQVGRDGLDSLTSEQETQIPDNIDRTNHAYEARLRTVFEHHPKGQDARFDNFLDVQLLWDEGMAERAARYLRENPQRRLVVLAGIGHLEYGSGIPDRVKRRIDVDTAVVLNGDARLVEAGIADFLLFPTDRKLPPSGKLGIILEEKGGGLVVGSFADDSAAQAAGLRKNDRIAVVDDQPIRGISDIRIALWDKLPGNSVSVRVQRAPPDAHNGEVEFQITLR